MLHQSNIIRIYTERILYNPSRMYNTINGIAMKLATEIAVFYQCKCYPYSLMSLVLSDSVSTCWPMYVPTYCPHVIDMCSSKYIIINHLNFCCKVIMKKINVPEVSTCIPKEYTSLLVYTFVLTLSPITYSYNIF